MADETVKIRILSAGAPKGGVGACAEAFASATGHQVSVAFATAPVLRGRVEGGEAAADIVVAPVPDLQRFEEAGLTVAGTGVPVGSVRAGVAVRAGAPAPDISSAAAFEQALLAADEIVYNEASSGRYIADLLKRLGLADALRERTVLVPNGAAAMKYLAGSRGTVIGFGQIPEIRRFTEGGVALAGPLPEPLGKTTRYAAGLLAGAAAPDAARALLDFMASPEARRLCAGAGLE
ncbi:MAG: substrate-binding domain-containing protein [Alphaproteobacteria bacterium]|nr:substrate-binding domain-containing protein [Alphaproteobacteria bacterium]